MITGRSFDRLVSFTDGVVAVAITLLVLPIVDIRGDHVETTVWQVLGDNASTIFSFVFTFVVVAVMWNVHNRLFNRLRGYDATVFRLNVLWLLGIVLLPWPSALLGEGIGIARSDWSGGEGHGGAGLFYWSTMAWIALMGALISRHIRRNPELVDPDSADQGRHALRGYVFTVAFVVFGIVSVFAPLVGSWLPLTIIVLEILFARQERTAQIATV